MSPEAHKDKSRDGQINAVIDPRLLFLAKVTARERGQTLIEFIEDAFRSALSLKACEEWDREDEAGSEDDAREKAMRRHAFLTQPLRNEGLWDEDPISRIFLTGIQDREMLTPSQQRDVFDPVIQSLIRDGKKVTFKNCVNAYEGN